MKTILAINGSASQQSANHQLLRVLESLGKEDFHFRFCEPLSALPHFDPALSVENPPEEIQRFRQNIAESDGILICTPEYVFSVPAGLKNALEWCVADTVFTDKPVGLITASASGAKGHEQLQLLLKTLGAVFTSETTLLISRIKSKVSITGAITDATLRTQLPDFLQALLGILKG